MKHLYLVLLLGVWPSAVAAEQIRFLFVPVDACGGTKQVAAGPDGAIGERLVGFGRRPQAYPNTFRPTHMVTFRHPFNGRNVTVPLTLPSDAPRMEHRDDRIIYNYGSYAVEAHFLPDGAVETVYNAGPFRSVVPQ